MKSERVDTFYYSGIIWGKYLYAINNEKRENCPSLWREYF